MRSTGHRRDCMRKLLILLALGALTAPARADIVIDNFSTNQTLSIGAGILGTVSGQISGPGILGNFRDMVLTKVAGVPATSSDAFFDGTVGTLFFSAGNGNRATLDLQYDGGTDAATPANYVVNGLAAFDATQGGANLGVA